MKKTQKCENGVTSQKGYRNTILGIFLITMLFGSGLYLAYDNGEITGMVTVTDTAEYKEDAKYIYPNSPSDGKTLTKEDYDFFVNMGKKPQIAGQQETEDKEAKEETQDGDYYGMFDGEYITHHNKDFMDRHAKNVGKVTDNKFVKDNVLVTTTGEKGPSTLNYGGESVTLPAGSGVNPREITQEKFTLLHTLDEMTWGGLGSLEVVDQTHFNLGNLEGFVNSDNDAVVIDRTDRTGLLTGDSPVWWSSMTVVNDKGETTTYKCDDAQDRCSSKDGTPTGGGDYTAETTTKDGITTQIIISVGGNIETTTNFKMMQFENPEDPSNPLRHNVVLAADGSAYYSEITLFGTQWFKFSPANCNGGLCPEGEETSELPDKVKDAVEESMYGEWWNRMGSRLDLWEQIITTGYSGMSLLYDEPDPVIELDETMSALLGGTDGWTSLICKDKMTDSLDSGMAFSSNPNGAYAHVEGEKIIVGHYNESLPAKSQYYKISASVDPGGEDTGCDIEFSLYLKGSGGTLFLYEEEEGGNVAYSQSEKTYELARGDSGISYSGSAMEFFEDERNFDKVCIKFHNLYPEFVSAGEGCLVGVNEGDEICNNLNSLGQIESFEDPCHNSFGFIMPHCWG